MVLLIKKVSKVAFNSGNGKSFVLGLAPPLAGAEIAISKKIAAGSLLQKVNMYLDKCRLSLPKVLQLQCHLSLSPALSRVALQLPVPHTQLILLIEIAVATRLIGSYSSLWPGQMESVCLCLGTGVSVARPTVVASGKWQVAFK